MNATYFSEKFRYILEPPKHVLDLVRGAMGISAKLTIGLRGSKKMQYSEPSPFFKL